MVGQGNNQHGVSGAQVLANPAGAPVELFAAGGEAVNHEGGNPAFELLRLVEGVLEVGQGSAGQGSAGYNSVGYGKGRGREFCTGHMSILVTSAGFLSCALFYLVPFSVSRPFLSRVLDTLRRYALS